MSKKSTFLSGILQELTHCNKPGVFYNPKASDFDELGNPEPRYLMSWEWDIKNKLFLQIEPLREENDLLRVRKDHVLALNTYLGAHT